MLLRQASTSGVLEQSISIAFCTENGSRRTHRGNIRTFEEKSGLPAFGHFFLFSFFNFP